VAGASSGSEERQALRGESSLSLEFEEGEGEEEVEATTSDSSTSSLRLFLLLLTFAVAVAPSAAAAAEACALVVSVYRGNVLILHADAKSDAEVAGEERRSIVDRSIGFFTVGFGRKRESRREKKMEKLGEKGKNYKRQKEKIISQF